MLSCYYMIPRICEINCIKSLMSNKT